jgi:hypothetical protein
MYMSACVCLFVCFFACLCLFLRFLTDLFACITHSLSKSFIINCYAEKYFKEMDCVTIVFANSSSEKLFFKEKFSFPVKLC